VTDGYHLDPKARSLWAVLAGGAGFVASLAVAGPLAIAGNGVLGVPVSVAAVIIGVLWARAAWDRFTWKDLPEALELRHGVWFHRASYVPYHRIQQIDVERGPLDRSMGLAKLVVRSASATTDARLPGLAETEARRLRQHLLERAGADDAV
jgi:membrane protein YdbS with pleckstrin-like domain